jgi:membrane-associated protein
MEILATVLDVILHIDRYIGLIISYFGIWSYVIVFMIVFIETGLVIFPFLPGDSLLFTLGAFSAIGSFDVLLIITVVSAAAIIGDTVNYWVGYTIGPRVFNKDGGRLLNKEYLLNTKEFYDKHGGKTIIIARFIPVIRTFAPFIAGVGRMYYPRFLFYNILGGLLWPLIFVLSGYIFGNIPLVKKYFSILIIAIVILSAIPLIIGAVMARSNQRNKQISCVVPDNTL